jgi:hypothetical protein
MLADGCQLLGESLRRLGLAAVLIRASRGPALPAGRSAQRGRRAWDDQQDEEQPDQAAEGHQEQVVPRIDHGGTDDTQGIFHGAAQFRRKSDVRPAHYGTIRPQCLVLARHPIQNYSRIHTD